MAKIGLHKPSLQRAFELLLDDGYFNDEMVFGSRILKQYFDELSQALSEVGYPNKLEQCGGLN